MKFKLVLPIVMASALSLGTQSFYPAHTQAQVMQDMANGQVNWTDGVIKVTGSGAAPSRGSMSAGQKRLMAKRAAIADAYRQLGELIKGVQVDSETVVNNFVTESDVVKLKMTALIKGAKLGKVRYMSDGTVEIDMELSLHGQNSVSSVVIPEVIQKKQIPTMPIPNNIPDPIRTPDPTQEPVSGDVTGIIIDCRGTGVKPAMSPQIKDSSGAEIYIGDRPIDPDLVVNIGIVGYANSMEQAKANSRIGLQPLVIKAVRAGGRFKTDAVIAPDKGQMILQADRSSGFLSKSKVLFIVDKD